ncbi:MAG: SwmB domain-containing protein, partial [Rhodococcus sp.]|nr:SwmB domain-containing protein [Rhodococcus sp. (in: high G+C Gram-positive bacteria)]
MVSVERAGESVTEGSGPIKFTLSLEEAHAADLDVTVEPSQIGTWIPARYLEDFVVTIPEGQLTQDFTVPLVNNSQTDPDGSVTMSVAAGGTAYGIGTPGTATVTVVDDDVPITVLINASPLRVSEGSGSAQLEFTLQVAGGTPPGTYAAGNNVFEGVPVAFSTRAETAQSPSDYDAVSTILQFQPGFFSRQPSGDYELTSSLQVAIHDDTLDEGASESFEVRVERIAGVAVNSLVLPSQPIRIVIEDDDTADLRLTVDPDTVKEGEMATVSARIDGDVVFGQTETVTLAFAGTATENSDYDADGASLTISPGRRGPSKNVVITTLEDDTVEGSETVEITATRNGEAVPGGIVLTIADESPPELRAAVVNKSTLTLTYSEVLDTNSKPPRSAYAVTVSDSPRTVSDVDVTGSAVTLNLASPVYHGQAVALTYTVPATNPVQDSDGSPAGALANVTVTNSTTAVAVSYDQSSFTATEGGADAVVTLRLSESPGRPLTIEITAVGRGGADANDYSGVPSGVTFQGNEMSTSFRVTAEYDEFDDGGESVELG